MVANDDVSSVIDLDALIKDWAWEEFAKTLTENEQVDMKTRYSLEIYYGHLEIKHDKAQYFKPGTMGDVHGTCQPGIIFNHQAAEDEGQLLQVAPYSRILHQELYQNDSVDENASHYFQFMGQTTSTWKTNVKYGFSMNKQLCLEFGMRGTGIAIDGDFASNQTWTDQCETKTETVSWGVNTEIAVPPKEKLWARMGVRNATLDADFRVLTHLSMMTDPTGMPGIPVRVYDLEEETSQGMLFLGNFDHILEPYYDTTVIRDPEVRYKVTMVTEGRTRLETAIRQEVEIEEMVYRLIPG